MTRRARALEIGLALAFAFALYLHATTGSLSDDYQPGIVQLKNWAAPGHLFLGLGALLLLASLWPARRSELARFAERLTLWMFAICVALGAGVLLSTLLGLECGSAPPSPPRQLMNTLRHSLLCPSFSIRSYGWAYQGALLSPGLLALARYLRLDPRDLGDSTPTRSQDLFAALTGSLFLASTPGVPFLAWGFMAFALPRVSILLVPFVGIALGLAGQALLRPLALLSMRRRMPVWVAPLALGATAFVAVASGSAARLGYAGWVGATFAGALLTQLAVLRMPLLDRSAPAQNATGQRPLGVE